MGYNLLLSLFIWHSDYPRFISGFQAAAIALQESDLPIFSMCLCCHTGPISNICFSSIGSLSPEHICSLWWVPSGYSGSVKNFSCLSYPLNEGIGFNLKILCISDSYILHLIIRVQNTLSIFYICYCLYLRLLLDMYLIRRWILLEAIVIGCWLHCGNLIFWLSIFRWQEGQFLVYLFCVHTGFILWLMTTKSVTQT